MLLLDQRGESDLFQKHSRLFPNRFTVSIGDRQTITKSDFR